MNKVSRPEDKNSGSREDVPAIQRLKADAAEARMRRKEFYASLFPANELALTGLFLSVAFLFQKSLPAKSVMLAFFIGASWFAGRKFSLLATLIVAGTIIAANLLVPFGKVLYQTGPFIVTEGALLDGVDKAVTFEGLMYLSKSSILPSLKIPGAFGAVVARSFLYYDRIVENRVKIRPATLLADADALMLDIWDSVTVQTSQEITKTGSFPEVHGMRLTDSRLDESNTEKVYRLSPQGRLLGLGIPALGAFLLLFFLR